jgi:hypothetical protein
MRIISLLTKYWRLIYGLGLALCLFYVFMGLFAEPSKTADTIIYTQVILRNNGASFAVPALGLLILGVGFYRLKRREFDGRSFLC